MAKDIPLLGIRREHESPMRRSSMVAKIALMSLLLLIGHDGIMAMDPHDVGDTHAAHGMHTSAHHDADPSQLSNECADPFGRIQSSTPTPGPSVQYDLPLFHNSISAPDAVLQTPLEHLHAIDSSTVRVLWQVFLN